MPGTDIAEALRVVLGELPDLPYLPELPARGPGAVRDLVASLAEGLRAHLADVRRRLPHARLLLQLDEPSLPAVLAGRVPTESGLGMLAPVEPASVVGALSSIVDGVGAPVVVH